MVNTHFIVGDLVLLGAIVAFFYYILSRINKVAERLTEQHKETEYQLRRLYREDYERFNTRYRDLDKALDKLEFKNEKLLEHLFRIIDPTSINKQGEDYGSQYRTGIYYEDDIDKEISTRFIVKKQVDYPKEIAVEVKKLVNFYDAEEYHQKYLDKNPNGYCHVNFNLIKSD